MARTHRYVSNNKPRHRNAIPYKRSNNPIILVDDFDYPMAIERTKRRKA